MYSEARRERLGHSHLRKVVSVPSGPSLDDGLSLSSEADPHTSLAVVHRRCGLRRVNEKRTQTGNFFYTIIEMDGKGKSQSERARRRGRADGVSRLFIFQAAYCIGRSMGERLSDTGH